jgi:hypothetical protein
MKNGRAAAKGESGTACSGMAEDRTREAEARAWGNGLLVDVADASMDDRIDPPRVPQKQG